MPGVVVFAGPLAGRGVVSIEHAGGLRTTYEPVTASVTAGASVAAGQPIGTLEAGHAGLRTGELPALGRPAARTGSTWIRCALLGPWRVRLLAVGRAVTARRADQARGWACR